MMKARRVLRESNEALREGYGFANQREDCIKFESKYDIEIVKEHQSVESSSTWKRDELEDITSEAIREKTEIPGVLFSRIDRFARHWEAAIYYLGLLRKNGLVVMFAQEDLIVDNEASAMKAFSVFFHICKADQDGKQIRHNMLGGRDKLAKEAHEVPNGMVIWPFDYVAKRQYGKITNGRPSINHERATWVKKWDKWIREEGTELAEVCRMMNNAGVLTPSFVKGRKNPANEWSSKAIRDILRSRQLVGEFRWKEQLYLKDENLRILTDEQFEVLQQRLDDNRERSYYNAAKYDYPPFRKMIFCAHHSNQIMYGKPDKRGKIWYYCPRCRKEGSTNEIRGQVIWEEYQREIKEGLLKEERLIPALRTQLDRTDLIYHLEQEIKTKQVEIDEQDRVKDRAARMGAVLRNYPYEKVQNIIDEAEKKKQRLEVEYADLNRRLKTLSEKELNEEGIRQLCHVVAKNLDHLSKNQWLMLNKLLKLKIIVHNKTSATVTVALPPINDTKMEFSRL